MNILSSIVFIGIAFILFIILYELYYGYERHQNRRTIYQLARRQSRETGRPLVIVGDPHNGIGSAFYKRIIGNYGYEVDSEDILIDLHPCEVCRHNPRVYAMDLQEALKRLPDDSAVIFVSCTLEYIPDIRGCIVELGRVSGSTANLYINHIQTNTLTSYFYVGTYLFPGCYKTLHRIFKAPPYHPTIVYETIN
jgi:hypothetical protein